MGLKMVLWGRDGAEEKMGPNGMALPWGKGDPWELGKEILKVGRWEKNFFWGVEEGLGSVGKLKKMVGGLQGLWGIQPNFVNQSMPKKWQGY
jgi:hypothetical protein